MKEQNLFRIKADNIAYLITAIINDLNRFQKKSLYYTYDDSCPVQIAEPIGLKWIQFICFSRIDGLPIFNLGSTSLTSYVKIAGVQLDNIDLERIYFPTLGNLEDSFTGQIKDISFDDKTGQISIQNTTYTGSNFGDLLKTMKDRKSITGSDLLSIDSLIKSVFVNKKVNYLEGPMHTEFKDDLATTKMVGTVRATESEFNKLLKSYPQVIYLYKIELDDTSGESLFFRLYAEEVQNKKKVTFTISEDIYAQFSILADKMAINKSKFIENRVIEFIEKNK